MAESSQLPSLVSLMPMPLHLMHRQLTGKKRGLDSLMNAEQVTTLFDTFIEIANDADVAYVRVNGDSKSIMARVMRVRGGYHHTLYVYNSGTDWGYSQPKYCETFDDLRKAFQEAAHQYLPIIRSAAVNNYILNNGEETVIYTTTVDV